MDKETSLEAQLQSAETIGAQLRILRQRAGYSLNGLAQVAGLDKGYLSRIENNLVPPPASATWDAYKRAILTPLVGTLDEQVAQSALLAVTNSTSLSSAAAAQILRDYPSLRRLIQFAAWVGLTDDERRAVDDVASRLSKRIEGASFQSEARGHRPILRKRRSSAKAKDRSNLGG